MYINAGKKVGLPNKLKLLTRWFNNNACANTITLANKIFKEGESEYTATKAGVTTALQTAGKKAKSILAH